MREWADNVGLVPTYARMPQYVDIGAVLSLAMIYGLDSEQVRSAMKEYRRMWQPHKEG
jgi:hypothetical protein